jgi:hypothetical protein
MAGIAALLAVFANADNATAAMSRQCHRTQNRNQRRPSNGAMKACLARMGYPHG